MLGKKTLAQIKIKRQNSKRLNAVMDIAINRIVIQKSGCFISGVGVSYINYINLTRDPIGHLLGYADLKGFWGLISSESQKPLVNKIRSKYGFDISHGSENDRLICFLQSMQDAHDLAFDEFNNPEPENSKRIENFISNCNVIKKDFKL